MAGALVIASGFGAADFSSTVPVPYVDETGCHVPTFDEIYAALINDFRGIYGSDVSLDNSTQDGQLVGSFAKALSNYATAYLSNYQAYAPSTAKGASLSSIVRTNGIERLRPSSSTVSIRNVGVVGAKIVSPVLQDPSGNTWTLPDFQIPASGEIVVTATCQTLGTVLAPPGTGWRIAAPQYGWQSATNTTAAAPGAPVEGDAKLRRRQAVSTEIAANTLVDAMQAVLEQISGVGAVRIYENDSAVVDEHGIPGHTVAVVVEGGDDALVAQAIYIKKGSAGTYGTASQSVLTNQGFEKQINYFRPTKVGVAYYLTIRRLAPYTQDTETAIANAVSSWSSSLGIGVPVYLGRAYGPALLQGTAAGATYEIVSIQLGRAGGPPQTADVPIAFNEEAYTVPSNVRFEYVP